MKRIITIFLLSVALLFAACSEDVNPNPELGGPLYGLSKGEPGSIEELLYNTWEYCGVYYLYEYSEYAFQLSNWSGYNNIWYTPVKKENKELVRKVVNLIQDEVFAGMDGDFIRRNWYVRVFLCDSLCDDHEYDPDEVVEHYLENGDMLLLPHLGETMKNYTDEDWHNLKEVLSNLLITRLYLGATEQPTAFFDLRYKDPRTGKESTYILGNLWVDDPLEEYSPNIYTFRTYGYLRSEPNFTGPETIFVPDRQMDVADYINFLTTKPKQEIDHVCERFPKILERVRAVEPYFENVLGLDIIDMQNTNCPEDKLPADYFEKLLK